MRIALLLLLALAACAAGSEAPLPPSPSTVSGERIWPEPRFTHWPAVVYADEDRNLSIELPVREGGVAGSVGWSDGPALPIVLPTDADRVSGLLPLPRPVGTHTAVITIGASTTRLALRLCDAAGGWPLIGLQDGYPVDAAGVPVVLVDRRRDPGSERQWQLLARGLPRGTGRPLLLGDPLEALGGDVWEGLDAERRPALDDRHPHHAALVALAALPEPMPRTLLWSPGNGALFGGAWTPEEERLFGAIRTRCGALGALPRLVLLLPPVPVDPDLQAQARERREALRRSAAFQGWRVLDVDEIAGPAETANRFADGVFVRHPIGPARDRLREALRAELAR